MALRQRADREGSSVEGLLRSIITREALRPKQEMLAELREHQRVMRETYGELPDSAPGIRQERERIG
jgi:hypothetical protein